MSAQQPQPFRLINSEVRDLTPELAEEFRNLPASPTERELREDRVRYLREKAEAGHLVTFHWATARFGGKKLRMNGMHSSTMLSNLNGNFPKNAKVHLDEYEVNDKDGLALLFRQFDARKSGRTPSDVSGAYQGLYDDLAGVPRDTAKIAVEGIAWWRRHVEGLPAPSGDDAYTLFGEAGTHGFVLWLGEVFSIKTKELKRVPIVAAMHATFNKNQPESRKFWDDVGRGGVKYDDNAPATVLDNWLKMLAEDKKTRAKDVKPGNYYQACIFAWNAYRDGKAISAVKFDTKKGLYPTNE
jgi:hypothetical protein